MYAIHDGDLTHASFLSLIYYDFMAFLTFDDDDDDNSTRYASHRGADRTSTQ